MQQITWSGIEEVITGRTRNALAIWLARGFESLPLRQKLIDKIDYNRNSKKEHMDINVNQMYHNIWQFKYAAENCMLPFKMPNGYYKSLWVAGVCNCAFACELEIKYILLKSKPLNIVRSHNLYDLFESYQIILRKLLEHKLKKNILFTKILVITLKLLKFGDINTKTTIVLLISINFFFLSKKFYLTI